MQTNAAPTAEVDTFTPGGTIAAGDVFTVSILYPDGSSRSITYTAGATPSAASVAAGLRAAWAADAIASAYAASGGAATFTLTAAIAGNGLNLGKSIVSASGTFTRAVTTPAAGRSIADILPGAPGARVLHNGLWDIP